MMLNVQQVWYVDKNLPKPLFLQLADNIKWSIRTGNIRPGEKLPSLRAMSKEIGVSIDTARAAYKLLEDEGYVVTRPHLGTLIKDRGAKDGDAKIAPDMLSNEKNIANLLLSYIQEGKNEADLRKLLESSLQDAFQKSTVPNILFVECDDAYGALPAKALADGLGAKIHFVNVDALEEKIRSADFTETEYKAVITTYFHYSMVKEALSSLHSPVFGVVLEFSPQTLHAISKFPASTKVGIICDTKDFKEYHVNQIKTLRDDLEIKGVFASDRKSLNDLLHWADVFFVSFAQHHQLVGIVDENKIFHYSDHINEQSIGLVNKMLSYLHENPAYNEIAE